MKKNPRFNNALSESEQYFRTLADTVPMLVWQSGPDKGCTYFNKGWLEFTGKGLEQLLGYGWTDDVHPDDLSRCLDAYSCAFDRREPFEVEYRLHHHSGQYRWILDRGSPRYHNSGTFLGYIGGCYDIHDRKQAEQSLAENERRFSSFMTHLPAAAWIKDLEGKYIYANREAERIFSKSLNEILGSTDNQLFPPETAAHFQANDRRAMANGNIETTEILRQADGIDHHSIVNKFAIRDINSKPLYAAGVAFDITERMKAQEALRESEFFYHQTIESIPGMVFTTRPDGYHDYMSSQWVEFTGVPIKQMLGDGWNKLLHPDDQPRAFAAWRAAAEERAPYDLEYRVRRHDGEYRWFRVIGRTIRDVNGNIVHWFGVALDIQDLKQAQENLLESEEKFRVLAENAQAVIGIVQGEKIIYANQYSETATGYSHEELCNIDIPKLIHPDYRKIMMDRAQRRQRGEPVESHYEFIMIRKDGQERWLDFSPIMIIYRGKPAIIGIAFDITERKIVEKELIRYRDQLESKNEELEAIIGIVSHDLRAPLVNIIGFGNEIAKDYETLHTLFSGLAIEQNISKQVDKVMQESIPESLKFMQASAEAMNKLVVTLVEVAHAGFAPVKPEKLDMNELVKKILESIDIKIKEAGVSYNVEDMPSCYADRTQTEQIFRNLLDNAMKYLDPNRPGEICIGGRREADSSLYWVADNGIGIAADVQQKIFKPYFQFKEKAAGGIGLGLTSVKRMVDRNGGKISVVSEKGKYTTFYVALPAHP